MTKYEKIAEWIISQEVNKSVKDNDIKEIADYVFNIKLTPTGIKYVKDELLKRNYINIKDAKVRDGFKWIVYLNGEPYYTAHSEDEAYRVESELYSASDTEDDFQSYYGSFPDVEIKKVRDSKFKDSDEDDLQFEVGFENQGQIFSCNTIREVQDLVRDARREGFKLEGIKIYFPNGDTYVNTIKELKETVNSYLEEMNLTDSKLPRNQKLWYGEELEKVVDPKFLRRNYQNKRLKTRKLRRRKRK